MPAQDIEKRLTKLRFVAGIPERVVRQLATASTLRDFRAGETIFREGSENRQMYLILQGTVALEMCIPARGCMRIMSLGPGDMLAWSALLGGGQMTTSAIATEDVEAIAVPGKVILDICDSDHEAGYCLMRQMAKALAQRLLATRLQLLDLFAADAPLIPHQATD